MNLTPLDTPKMPFAPGDDLPTIIARHAQDRPDGVALVEGERSVTWADLARGVARVAGALLQKPRARGERVAMLAANSVEYVEAFFGALHAGLCAVPLPTLASAETLALMLDDCGATVLFASSAYRNVAEGLVKGRKVDGVGFDFESDAFTSYQRFVEAAPANAATISGDDAFDIIYSSGTTGVPKGIVHSHAARKASYGGSRASFFGTSDVNVIATPFYSNTTCVTWFIATATGGTNLIVGKFSPDAFLGAVEKHHATHAMLVPVQYDRILESERFARTDVSSLKFLFSTSAPLRAETKRQVLDRTKAELIEIYGLTEGGPVTVLDARKHPDKLASVGKPSPGVDVRVVDEAGQRVPAGQAGEVIGRSSNMMDGYLNRAEDTDAMLFRTDGALFFKTGDLGRFDEDGFLYLLDRKKDVIITGGFNVYATDLEAVLVRHEDVSEVTVIGIPSKRWGETPLALVVLRAGARATSDELLAFCNERVGKIQRLAAVELRDELPKNAIGKILKRELRAPYWKERA
ncbi:MAG TPA: class I adenylate-forming enzyme family protein [Polyangiaceae bacterium]|jgi:acyl-CoA synthetase (AMP-forming)/AMP-acid ligase II|nr:class I adenylate-forming enzyme family protein [Polyangiaceae bacterium]